MRRIQTRAARKKAEAERRYLEAKKLWDELPEEVRRMRPELDPELLKP